MRQGNFSELLSPNNFYYGRAVQIKNPTTGVAYPGNIIPANQLSPNGLGLLKAFPEPTLTTPIGGNGNWYASALHTIDQRKDQLNADMVLTSNQRLSFRRNNYVYANTFRSTVTAIGFPARSPGPIKPILLITCGRLVRTSSMKQSPQ
jgi:hypothetical protein